MQMQIPIPKRSTIEFLTEFFETIIPDVLFSKNHTSLAFICLAAGTFIYGYIMLDDIEVDDWKTALGWIGVWFVVVIFGGVLSTKEFAAIHENETFSKMFVFGMLAISVAYVVISIKSWRVRTGCLVRGIATLIAISRFADGILYTYILMK